MSLYGKMAGGTVILTDQSDGVPVIMADEPAASAGYVTRSMWVQEADGIKQVWRLEPAAGTIAQATYALARMQAESLSDEDALKVVALYEDWSVPANYSKGQRVAYHGKLYKVLSDHASQADWAPDKAPSLFAEVLPGQDGKVGEWKQPDSTNPYSKGDRVTHNGKTWESTVDGNVWEPGATGVTQWTEVKE